MISGIGSGGTFGAGAQPAARTTAEPLRTNSARIPANAGPSEEPLSRPRPPGPTEVDGPQVWGNGYLSPVYRFDDSTSTLFFEQRAFVTGDTTRQVPLESAVKLYNLFEQVRQSTPPGQSGEAETSGQGDAAQADPVPLSAGRETPEATATGQTEAVIATGGIQQPAVAETVPIRQPSSAAAGPVGQLLNIVA